jgi:hypothetical protein
MVTMSMKNRVFIGVLLAFVLTGATLCSVLAQSETLLGVKEGDNFTYTFIVNWSSTDPNVVVPQEFSDMNQTLLIHFNVTSVGSTIAYLDINKTMRGGSVSSSQGYIEVVSGRGVDALLFITGANLTAGQKAYPQSDPTAVKAGVSAESFTIDETVTRTYMKVAKTVNHYTETVTNQTTGDYVKRDAYYEQSTGVLMEMKIEHYWASLGETDAETWTITQFNSEGASVPSGNNGGNSDNGTNTNNTNEGLPSWLVPVLAIVVVVLVVALVATITFMRRKKPQAQTETPPSPQPQETV